MNEIEQRDEMVRLGRSIFERGLTPGSSGNLSVRLDDGGYLMTPTNACLGFLDPELLSKLDGNGNWVSGDKPTKEAFMHLAMYDANPQNQAVVHLHSTYCVCLSCMKSIDPQNVVASLTPYLLMQIGRVALVPYHSPGDKELGPEIGRLAEKYTGIIIANHGPLVSGKSLRKAVFSMEELEESAKLQVLLHEKAVNYLSEEEQQKLLAWPK